MNSVVFKGSNLRIGINVYTYYLKAPPTQINGSSSAVIRGITTPFLLCNIDQNYYSVKKSTQFQSSKTFPDNYIDFEGTNLI